MSQTTGEKINQVMNPKYLGFSIAENSDMKYDDEIAKDVEKLHELSRKLKEKLSKAVPEQYQIKEESKQLEDDVQLENLNQIGKKFSFQSVDNLKKNIHLFDPKLEKVKHDLQTQAQQQKLTLLMNSLQSFGGAGGDGQVQQGNQKNSNSGQLNSNTVSQCLSILESQLSIINKYTGLS